LVDVAKNFRPFKGEREMTNTTSKTMLQALQTEHDELLEEIADIQQFWMEVNELGLGPKYEEMASRVHQFRERLKRHFAEEERDGYLAPAITAAPRLAPKAEKLKQQHPLLLETLDGFSQQLEQRESAYHNWDEVHSDFEAFLEQMHEHESAEMAILRAASS
jgi:Hemerythrin HHE cation binding domain